MSLTSLGRRLVGALTLAPMLLLNGCGSGINTPTTLHVLVVPNSRMEWFNRYYRDPTLLNPLVAAFRKLHPEVSIQLSTASEAEVEEQLRLSHSRGLGPDLVVLHAPKAISLLERGLIDPLPSRDPALRRTLSQIDPAFLRRASTAEGLAGLPVVAEVTLACYDKRHIPQAPKTLSELLAVAAAGNPVGLAMDPTGLYWTAGALGATEALRPIFLPSKGSMRISPTAQREDLLHWLSWLRESSLQARVDLASGPKELTLALESGQLRWIPCFSPVLLRLNHTMGRHLGVAPLPNGPEGPPSPFISSRVWALGIDSSATQRRLALQLAELSLDPMLQRAMTLSTRFTLPTNRYVPIPVASSAQLAALATGLDQFLATAWAGTITYSQDEVAEVWPALESVVQQVMLGILTPEQGTEQLLRLERRQP